MPPSCFAATLCRPSCEKFIAMLHCNRHCFAQNPLWVWGCGSPHVPVSKFLDGVRQGICTSFPPVHRLVYSQVTVPTGNLYLNSAHWRSASGETWPLVLRPTEPALNLVNFFAVAT